MPHKPKRADGQLSGLSGEFFVAAELLKRGLQTSLTFGNAKAVDLFAHNPFSDTTFTVQVKTVRTRNFFMMPFNAVNASHVYVFVILRRLDQSVRYFIVPGSLIRDEPERFGESLHADTIPGIKPQYLDPFENNWQAFGPTT